MMNSTQTKETAEQKKQHNMRPPSLRPSRRLLTGALGIAGAIVFIGWIHTAWTVAVGDRPANTVEVNRSELVIYATASGELESVNSVDIRCEVEGFQPKITELLSEGTTVKKGQVIATLDAGEIKRALIEQRIKVMQADAKAKAAREHFEIQKNIAASKVAQAELDLKLAALDKGKYLEGEYKVEVDNLKGSIALAEAELQDAKETAEHYRRLVKKGFRTPEQLRAKEQELERSKYFLNRDKEKLRVLETFTRERNLVELTAKAEETARELERAERSGNAEIVRAKTEYEAAEATARLERSQLERLEKQLEHCTIKAPQDGVLVYANQGRDLVEPGATVFQQQKLFSLPDLANLQVKAYLDESVVEKVKPGMTAEIDVEALSDVVLQGRVESVSPFFDSLRNWMLGGVKEYATTIKIDRIPIEGLKPGMTVQVQVLVAKLSEVLVVPIAAVAESDGDYSCFVFSAFGVDRRSVSLGQSNDSFVEITEGLKEGDRVLLDARRRLASQREAPGVETNRS